MIKIKTNQIIDENVEKYKENFFTYLDKEKNETTLNLIFTEITLLKLKLDKHDNFFTNLKESKKLPKEINKKNIIKFEFDDIIKTSKFRKYSKENYALIENIMQIILPQEQKKTLKDFLLKVKQNIDNCAGKKNE